MMPIPTDRILQGAFVDALSHELRTPITSIYGGAQLLLRQGVSSEMRSSVIRDIAAEAERLYRLVEDVLAIARVDGPDRRDADEPVLMQHHALAAAAWEERQSRGRRVTVSFARDLPAAIGDDAYVAQILRNLIANAIEESPSATVVEVRLSHDDHEVAAHVLDRGTGLALGAGDDAFALFAHSPDIARRRPGTGIGLFVARILAEVQGGRVWAVRRPGGGADVGVALPRYRSVS